RRGRPAYRRTRSPGTVEQADDDDDGAPARTRPAGAPRARPRRRTRLPHRPHRQGTQVRARGGADAHRAQCPRTRAPRRAAAGIGQTRTEGVDRDMRHHTVTATFSAPPDEVFAYIANIDNLPNWTTDFARELKLVDGRHKDLNRLAESFLEID